VHEPPDASERNAAPTLALSTRLVGRRIPPLALPSTGGPVSLAELPPGRSHRVLYAYPLTGRPEVPAPDGWDAIPGARGCTSESCGFRDHAIELSELGAVVAGVSSQSPAYQREAAERLRLPFPLLSDAELTLADSLGLPTFVATLRPEHDGGGRRVLLQRLTLVLDRAAIERVFYPVPDPEHHAEEVVRYLRSVARGP
jgi:peroxiredoxin